MNNARFACGSRRDGFLRIPPPMPSRAKAVVAIREARKAEMPPKRVKSTPEERAYQAAYRAQRRAKWQALGIIQPNG